MSEDADVDLGSFCIEEDMRLMGALPRPPPPRRAIEWRPLFLPTEYARAHPDIGLEQYRLGERRLRTLGEEISKHRQRLREVALAHDKALALEQEKDLHEVSCLARRIRRGDYNDGAVRKQQLRPDFKEPTPAGSRRRMKKRQPLTTGERISIVHQVLVGHEKHADVAKDFRVSPQVVSAIMQKARKSPEFMREMLERKASKAAMRELVKKHVEVKNDFNIVIDSAQAIANEMNATNAEQVTEKAVRSVLREELDMRYRKIKTVSLHSNSEKNLVLRQRWALEFLAQARRKNVFLNVDETWLGMSDFRRRKWQAPGTTNSVPKIEVAPRVTMILGLDTLGNIYAALAQANSNSAMMELFFRSLAFRLDQQRPSWRKDTVIIVDGAKDHQSKEFLRVGEELWLPYMLLGPHSYDAAPCELVFAHFKKADVNPRHVPTGKK